MGEHSRFVWTDTVKSILNNVTNNINKFETQTRPTKVEFVIDIRVNNKMNKHGEPNITDTLDDVQTPTKLND